MGTLEQRLRAERERLRMSQTAFGEIGGVQKRAQINYEAGERSPDATYLAAIAGAGADVLYILTGERMTSAAQGLPADQQLLLEAYLALSVGERKLVLADLLTGAAGKRAGDIQVSGDNNRTAGRDYKEGK